MVKLIEKTVGAYYKKLFYIIVMLFSIILILSYNNILFGGKILYMDPIVYFITITTIQLSFFYIFVKSNKIENLDVFIVMFFCISLMLLFFVIPGIFTMNLDSILSIKSIDFLMINGFSTKYMINNFPLLATYSLPGLSILAANFALISGLSHTLAGKYVIFLIGVLSIIFIYLFINKFFDKKTALLSILMLISFPVINLVGSAFSNSTLGIFLFVMFMYTLTKLNKNRWNIIILQVLILILFAFSHHINAIILIITLITIHFYNYLSRTYLKANVDSVSLANITLFFFVLVFGYYCFMYFAPLEIMIKSFTGQLIAEGQQGVMIPLLSWTFQVILQRIGWVLLIFLTIFLMIKKIRSKNLKSYLQTKNALFLFLGGMFFVLSVVIALTHAPFGWDRINIFGWLFFIPAFIFLYLNLSNKSTALKVVSISIIGLLIFANFYSNDLNFYDHSGNNEYSNNFKNWATIQEYDSVDWILMNKNLNDRIKGDVVILRIYSSNINNLYASLSGKPSNSLQLNSSNYHSIMNDQFNYLIIRKENFYHILWGNDKLNNLTYNKISTNLSQIYDNGNVFTFIK